jgi:hypothetical protein
MVQALEYEKVDEHGRPTKRANARSSHRQRKAKKPRVDTAGMAASSDENDEDFGEPSESESQAGSDGNSDSEEDVLPSNAEVSYFSHSQVPVSYKLYSLGC